MQVSPPTMAKLTGMLKIARAAGRKRLCPARNSLAKMRPAFDLSRHTCLRWQKPGRCKLCARNTSRLQR